MKKVLTIAGSDCSGGAGIQADIKTIAMHGVYAMSAITALTAQNTTGVKDILETGADFLTAQLDAVFEDIYPDAVKIGMVSSQKLICVIADRLRHYKAKNIVVDPVMVATSGGSLIKSEAVSVLVSELFPLATLITPNIPEAEVLAGMSVRTKADIKAAAKKIGDSCGCAVLVKGGHLSCDAADLLYSDGEYRTFDGERIFNPNTHGTGCTLSSAIAANLAKGLSLEKSAQKAKEYVTGALLCMLDLGKGPGPLNHMFGLGGGSITLSPTKKSSLE